MNEVYLIKDAMISNLVFYKITRIEYVSDVAPFKLYWYRLFYGDLKSFVVKILSQSVFEKENNNLI